MIRLFECPSCKTAHRLKEYEVIYKIVKREKKEKSFCACGAEKDSKAKSCYKCFLRMRWPVVDEEKVNKYLSKHHSLGIDFYRLYSDLSGGKELILRDGDTLENLSRRLEEILGELPKREQIALRARYSKYRDGHICSYRMIGDLLGGISASRVQQLIQKVLRKLRHPKRYGYFVYKRRTMEVVAPSESRDRADVSPPGEGHKLPSHTKSLPLSYFRHRISRRTCRLMNCHGLKTLGDLIDKTPDELISLPGCGIKTVNEIRRLLKSDFGIDLAGTS